MANINLLTPQHTGSEWWNALSKQEKSEVLEPYLEAGASNKAIATLLEIPEGGVARRRHMRNQRLHPERYNPDGTPIAKKPATKPVLPKAPKPKMPPAKVKSNVVKLKCKPRKGDLIPAENSPADHTPAAEHPPGKSPMVNQIPELRTPRGGKDSPFPATREQTNNPEHLSAAEIAAIEKAGYSDKG